MFATHFLDFTSDSQKSLRHLSHCHSKSLLSSPHSIFSVSMSSPTSVVSGSLIGGEVDPISLLDTTTTTTTTSTPDAATATTAKTTNAKSSWTVLPASQKSLRTTNPIRALVDPIVANIRTGKERGDGKDLISLAVRHALQASVSSHRSISKLCLMPLYVIPIYIYIYIYISLLHIQLGDPTASGNLPPCPVAIQAIQAALASHSHAAAAGYIPATGLEAARHAIANFHSIPKNKNNNNNNKVSPNQVVIANGCSGALELALTALLDEGSILLVPQPGFPLYQVIAESHGATVVHYNLLPNSNWECDLKQLHALMQQYGPAVVRGMVVNNPSNPTGAVFSKQHLRDIVQFCEQYALPLVADEVYGDLTFDDHVFVPVAHVAAELGSQVPVITASGLGKQFLVPGWRVGWVVFQDK